MARGRPTDVFPGPSRPLDDIERRLLDDIAATPDDDQPRLVLADWWLSGPDPARGELVATQCRGEDASELIEAYEQRWFGGLAAAGVERFELVRGFAARPLVINDTEPVAIAADTRRVSPRVYLQENAFLGRRVFAGRSIHGERVAIKVAWYGELVEHRIVFPHPHLVALLDVTHVHESAALVYAWAGSPLPRRPHSIATVAAVGRQVAGALVALHAAGILHCGVAPDHVFVDDGHVRLGGLGQARSHAIRPDVSVNVPQSARPAIWHLSPEQVRGHALTNATDMFSLAVTLATWRLGRRPVGADGATEYDTVVQISQGAHQLPEDPELRPLLTAMMAPDPAARPTAVEVERALAQLQRG